MANTATKPSKTVRKAPIQPEPDTEIEDPAPPSKKKRSVLKILLLLALPLCAAAGGAWYFLQEQQAAAATKPGAAKAAGAKAVAPKPPVFVALEPFTVNLQHEDPAPQYLQVGLSLKVTDSGLVDALKLHMPEIRNRVLLLLSSKRASEISTTEGKQTLSTELTREIVQPLAGTSAAQGLESVLFTSFVIQ